MASSFGDGALTYGFERIGEVYCGIVLPRYHIIIIPDYPAGTEPRPQPSPQ